MITWSIPSAGTSVGSASRRPQHLQPVDHRPLLQRVVVHEPPQVHVLLAPAADLPHRHHPGRPRPDEQHRRPRRAAAPGRPPSAEVVLEDRPARHPDPQQAAKGRQRVHDDDRDGDAQVRVALGQEEPEAEQDSARARAGADERRHLGHPDVLPDEGQRPADVEGRELDGQHQGQLVDGMLAVDAGDLRTRTAAGRPARRPPPSPAGRSRTWCGGSGDGAGDASVLTRLSRRSRAGASTWRFTESSPSLGEGRIPARSGPPQAPSCVTAVASCGVGRRRRHQRRPASARWASGSRALGRFGRAARLASARHRIASPEARQRRLPAGTAPCSRS